MSYKRKNYTRSILVVWLQLYVSPRGKSNRVRKIYLIKSKCKYLSLFHIKKHFQNGKQSVLA